MTLAEFFEELRYLWACGVTKADLQRVMKDLSSCCLPPQMPGRIRMPDGFIAEIVTTQAYLRIDIGDEDSEGKRTYWVDRDKLIVVLPAELAACNEGIAEVGVGHALADRVLYVLKQLRKWNPIVPSDHGLVDPNALGMPHVDYVKVEANDEKAH